MILDILMESNTDDILLNEAYYGKNELLIDCENQFAKLKGLMKQYGVAYNLDLDKGSEYSKIIEKIENNFKKLFGFDDVIINTTSLSGTLNAFTFSNQYDINFLAKSVNKSQKFVKTKYGSMALAPNNYQILVVNITHAIIQESTPAEIVAVVLHEIGHNFYNIKPTTNLNTTLSMALMIESLLPINLLGTYVTTLKIPHLLNRIKNKLSKDVNMYRIFNLNDIFESNMSMTLGVFSKLDVSSIISNLLLRLVMIIKSPIHSLSSYKDEKYADRFASSYGYSNETISVQGRFTITSYAGKNNFVYLNNFINDLYCFTIMIPLMAIDPHPSTYTRMKDQIRYLEKQLELEKNPRLKKYIQQDLDSSLELIKYYEKSIPTLAKKNGKLFTATLTECFKKQGYTPEDYRELLTLTKTSVNDLEFNDLK